MLSKITVTHSPHISKRLSTRTVMLDVIVGLAPAVIMAGYFFRIRTLIVIAACVISAAITECLCNVVRKRPRPWESLGDLSAVLTGLLLALSLPPNLPISISVIGSAVAIAIGKMVFGGLGANVFNPAMVGRTFLSVSFGFWMTSWTVPAPIAPTMPAVSATSELDSRTQATPLAWAKEAIKTRKKAGEAEDQAEAAKMIARGQAYAKTVNSQLKQTCVGNVAGCVGETSALALLLGGVYLLIRKTISIHIPAAVLLSTLVFSSIVYLANPDASISPLSHLCNGGLLLCAFFIATDPVTAPLTTKGMWIFGTGVGTLIMLIRVVGEYPEGVMFAVLLMNAVTPLIDRLCKRIPVGGKPDV